MRVLHLTPGLRTGGAEAMLVHLVTEQVRNGDDVLVACLFDDRGTRASQLLDAAGARTAYLGKMLGPDLRMFWRVAHVVRNFEPDVVHTHRDALRYALWPALRSCWKFVHTIHTDPSKEGWTRADRRLYRLLFRTRRVTPVLVTASTRTSAQMVFGVSPAVIHNGIPVEDTRPKRRVRSNEVRLICVGRLVASKNHAGILRSLAELHRRGMRASLTIVGDGPSRDELGALTAQLRLEEQVVFLGERPDVEAILAEHDIFVSSSLREGMPISILEAMAAGLPVVAFDVGGTGELIQDGEAGLLVPLQPG